MYLGLLVLFLQQIQGKISVPYRGFEACWHEGWECRNYQGQPVYNSQEMVFEVTYNCENYTRESRVWVWTARLPEGTKKFIVTNCNYTELHLDCTQSRRNVELDEFRVVNVHHLDILGISRGYLHDNGEYYHLPPLFHLENIKFLTSAKGVLRVSRKLECQYNSGEMRKLIMKKVTIEKLEKEEATGNYDVFWSGVTVKAIESNAINVTGNITIEDSHFPKMKSNAMSFKGQNVILRRNIFNTIKDSSIKVNSFTFNFTENRMNTIARDGLKIKSSKVSIERNHIVHLDPNALGSISPYYYLGEGEYKLSYSFLGNQIKILSPFSLHCNWKEYEKTCTKFYINDNKFDCTCYNLVWLNAFQENKTLEHAGFYGIFLNSTHHCGTSVNCSLSKIIKFVCHNESMIEAQCSGFREDENIDVPTEDSLANRYSPTNGRSTYLGDGTADPSREISYRDEATTGGQVAQDPFRDYQRTEKHTEGDARYYNSNDEDSNKMILGERYYKSVTVSTHGPFYDFPKWLIGVIAIALIALIATVFIVWHFRRRKNRKIVRIYKYEKNKDSDNLIAGTRIEVGNLEGSNNFSYD